MKKTLLTAIIAVAAIFSSGNIFADTITNAKNPKVAISASGDAVAIWQAYDDDEETNVIVSASYTAATNTWGSPSVISDPTTSSTNPLIARNSTGNTIAIWSAEDDVTRWLIGANYPAGGTWGTSYAISTADDIAYSTTGSYTLSLDNSNNVVVIWTGEDPDSGDSIIKGSYAVFGGGWTTVDISTPPSP